jgi:hypothetical protein
VKPAAQPRAILLSSRAGSRRGRHYFPQLIVPQLIVNSADLSSSWLSDKCSPTGSIATDCHQGVVPKRFIEPWSPTPRRRGLGGPDPESVHSEN